MNEPSQRLLDEVAHQFDTRVLRYVEPAKANSRESEVIAGRSDRKLRIESNTLAIKESKVMPDEDVSTAMQLMQCMRRRAVAYEFANLISFVEHERYIDKLLRRLQTTPPPNYQSTTLSQILRADREVWLHLSQNCNDIRPNGNVRPLDNVLRDALQDYNVTFHLLPLPLPAKDQSASTSASYAPLRPRDDSQGAKGYGGGKGKSKQKGKSRKGGKGLNLGSSHAPRGIEGAVGRDSRGRPICFDYNLGTYPLAAVGGTCPKGRHICFKANCFKLHSFAQFHASEMPAASPAA